MNKTCIFYLIFHTLSIFSCGLVLNKYKNNIILYEEHAIGKWKLLYTDNEIFYQQNIKKKEIINLDKKLILYSNDNEYNKIELNIYPDYETINSYPKLLLKIKKYEKQNFITYSKIINCNLFMSTCEEIDNLQIIEENEKIDQDKCCSLVIVKSEKMIKSFGIFEFPHITFLYKSAMNSTYAITWKVDTLLNRLYVYFDNNTYVFERDFYDEMIMNKQSITTNTFIVTNIISFIMCKLLEKIFDGK